MLTTHNHSLFSVTFLILDPHKFSLDFQSMLQCFTKPSVPQGPSGSGEQLSQEVNSFRCRAKPKTCIWKAGLVQIRPRLALPLEKRKQATHTDITRGLCYSRVFHYLWGKHKRKITLTWHTQVKSILVGSIWKSYHQFHILLPTSTIPHPWKLSKVQCFALPNKPIPLVAKWYAKHNAPERFTPASQWMNKRPFFSATALAKSASKS